MHPKREKRRETFLKGFSNWLLKKDILLKNKQIASFCFEPKGDE